MKQKIIARLVAVICEKGYSEMSISSISEATGLKKSSLYHFFPEGKAQIAYEIVQFVDDMLTHSFEQIMHENELPLTKFNKILDVLSDCYQQGQQGCLIDIMTISYIDERTQLAIKDLLLKLIGLFKRIFILKGSTEQAAEEKAIETVMLIQGSLVLSRATKQPVYFMNCIHKLKTGKSTAS
ncbi:MAG: TetR/AcrR family transcriptional regulator [Legionellales bacterium]|nr:TetR/AcrR family transcriptional regulator [Legionellales bacterium]